MTPGGSCEAPVLDPSVWLVAILSGAEPFKLLWSSRSSFFVAPKGQGLRLDLSTSSTVCHRQDVQLQQRPVA